MNAERLASSAVHPAPGAKSPYPSGNAATLKAEHPL
jgi:hypothetical protein